MRAIGDTSTPDAADALVRGPQRPIRPGPRCRRCHAGRADRARPPDRRPPRQFRRDRHRGRGDRRPCRTGAAVRDRIDPWADREVTRAIELTPGTLRPAHRRRRLRGADARLPVLDPRLPDPTCRDDGPRGDDGARRAGGRWRHPPQPRLRGPGCARAGDRSTRFDRRSPARTVDRPPHRGVADGRRRGMWRRCSDDCAMMTTSGSRTMARRLGPSGDDLTDTGHATGDIATMLQLRRVPLFEMLSAEDLQRIARSADGALVRRGRGARPRGRARRRAVRHRRGPGPGRPPRRRRHGAPFRTYARATTSASSRSSGRPRVATVVADGGSVRALVIGGEGLTAILRERPDAAMAMLATLAERLSTAQ